MLYLDPGLSKIKKAEKEFYDELEKLVDKRVQKLKKVRGNRTATLFNIVYDGIIKPNLRSILIGDPTELKKINDRINPLLEQIPERKEGVQYVFDYKLFTSKSKDRYDAYDLAERLDIRTCTYCNRNYTTTVIKKDGQKITRPQFDHFFDKSKNPILALSFYNLIPSCSICNSGTKGSKIFTLGSHLQPYLDNKVNDIYFTYKYTNETNSGLKIQVLPKTASKEKNTIDDFAIEEIYNSHIGELEDMLKARKYFSDKYLEVIKSYLLKNDMSVSQEDIYRIVFGTEYNSDKFINRPFSKFKKDILTELGVV